MTSAGGDLLPFHLLSLHLTLFLWLCPLLSTSPGAWASHQQSSQRGITQSPNPAVLIRLRSILSRISCPVLGYAGLLPYPRCLPYQELPASVRVSVVRGSQVRYVASLTRSSAASTSRWTSGLKKTSMPKASSQHCGCDHKPMLSCDCCSGQHSGAVFYRIKDIMYFRDMRISAVLVRASNQEPP